MAKAGEIPNISKPPLNADTAAEKLAASPENADYKGERFDVFLGEEAKAAVTFLMHQHNLSASRVIDTLVRGSANLPVLELNKWFSKK